MAPVPNQIWFKNNHTDKINQESAFQFNLIISCYRNLVIQWNLHRLFHFLIFCQKRSELSPQQCFYSSESNRSWHFPHRWTAAGRVHSFRWQTGNWIWQGVPRWSGSDPTHCSHRNQPKHSSTVSNQRHLIDQPWYMYKSHESYEVFKIHMKYMAYSFESVIIASDVFLL